MESKTNATSATFDINPNPQADSAPIPPQAIPQNQEYLKRIGLALLPLTPVKLTGKDALYGWGRLALYGSLAYLSFPRSKKLSYIMMGATGLSLTSSLLANTWDKKEQA